MDQNTSFNQNINTLFSEIQDFTKTESIMGKPVSCAGKTFIPVVSVTLGYGSGTTPTKTTTGTENSNTNLGLGARITTNGVVVIDKDSVSMLPVNEKNNFNQMVDKLPEVLTSLKQGVGQQGMGQSGNQQQSMNQNQQPNNNMSL